MSRLATSFVLAYHGCDEKIARQVLRSKTKFVQSNRDFDWLGSGAYFWESDPQRALEWAQWKAKRGDYSQPAVVGAVIDLRNCLDLLTRQDIELLRVAYDSFKATQQKAGLAMPTNRDPKGSKGLGNNDRLLRFLDRAVINHLHEMIEAEPANKLGVEPFDTVRGMFTEGSPVYAGCGFRERTHVQIAVRNDACIKGVFRLRDLE